MKINNPSKLLALLATASFVATASFAQVTSDVVGYVTTTTPDGDDALIGASLTLPSALTGAAVSVSGAIITVSNTLVADEYNNTHYLLATSGSNAGQWSEIIDTTTSTITTAEELIAEADNFKVIPFWTLSTLFPLGSGVGVSTSAVPVATVLLNNLNATGINKSASAAYFYFSDGSNDGWYNTTTFAQSDNVIVSPETYFTIRNNSGESVELVIAGTVPGDSIGTTITRSPDSQTDSQLVNPFPAAMTLAESGLSSVITPTTNPSAPADTVLVYDIESAVGQNISVSASYMYYVDGINDGWYDTTSFAQSDNVSIPAGGAFIVRRSAGSAENAAWNPAPPYSL